MNKVTIEGYVESVNSSDSEIILAVQRDSGAVDYIPVKTSFTRGIRVSDSLKIFGHLRTENSHDEFGKMHKHMYIKAKDMSQSISNLYENSVEFEGTLCKKDILRSTPNGRKIIDFVIAVNNKNENQSYYISCIAWFRNSELINSLPIGSRLHMTGRFQSREYTKNEETRTAYEISINRVIEIFKNSEEKSNV